MADQINVGPPPVPLRGNRSYKGIAIFIVLLAVIAAGAGFAWFTYGDRLAELSSFGSGSGASAAPSVASDNSLVAASEFQAFQQQTSEALQSATQLLTAQQGELKRLSDEVSGLTAKIDLLQNTVASARPAPPPAVASSRPAAPAPVTATSSTAAPAAVAAPRKRPVVPKPAGAISVGGAPLPASTPPAR